MGNCDAQLGQDGWRDREGEGSETDIGRERAESAGVSYRLPRTLLLGNVRMHQENQGQGGGDLVSSPSRHGRREREKCSRTWGKEIGTGGRARGWG